MKILPKDPFLVFAEFSKRHYLVSLGINEFGRKNYMEIFKNISTATASRDLKKVVELGMLKSIGNKNKTKYILSNN